MVKNFKINLFGMHKQLLRGQVLWHSKLNRCLQCQHPNMGTGLNNSCFTSNLAPC